MDELRDGWVDCWMNEEKEGWMNGYQTKIDKQVIWRVLLDPGEELWRVGGQGVRLQHVTTGKILTVTRSVLLFFLNFQQITSSNGYPESWGEGMHEVVAGDPKQTEGTLWAVNYFQLPNIGVLCEYGLVHSKLLSMLIRAR